MWAWGLWACGGADETGPTDVAHTATPPPTADTGHPAAPVVVAGPAVEDPEDTRLRLVRILSVTTDRPTRAEVVLDDGERRRSVRTPELATEHRVPLLGLLQATSYAVEVVLRAETGEETRTTTRFTTETIPELLPDLELRVDDPGAEPGVRMVPIGADDVPFVVLGLDRDARPVWALATGEDVKALSFEPSTARLGWLHANHTIRRMTPWGTLAQGWAPRSVRPGDLTPVDVSDFHHEAAFEADGSFWSLLTAEVAVPAFPVSERTPLDLAPATIVSDTVVHVAVDGSLLETWPLDTLFPTTRIGYDSLQEWSHANAVVPLPGEDAVLVSLRHQDAVARIRRSTGEVEWVLANHDGWPAAWSDRLLEPLSSPFGWPYHQHAPFATADGDLWLFDNGNHDRTTPYAATPAPGPLTSRLVRYHVDPGARTVTQTFAFHDTGTPPLYSKALGNCDVLPVTGHVFATFSYLYEEDGVSNVGLGLGKRTVRLLEVDPATGGVVWDLRLSGDADVAWEGYQVDRAVVIGSLYPEDVEETWLDP